MIRDSAALRNLGEHLLKFCSDVVAVLLKSPHSLPLSWGSSQTIPHSVWGSVWEMGHPPRYAFPSPFPPPPHSVSATLGLRSVPQTLRLWLWSRRAPHPSMPLECPFTSLSPAHSSGLLSSDAASVRKPSRFLQAELLSPLPFSFQTVCAWLSPTFSIRMCILENTCIFPHYVTLLALGPSHSGQKYPGGIPESPGHDSRVPLAGSAAAFPCEMFLESVSSPLS